MVYLLFFGHSFDVDNPDLLGVFESKEEAISAVGEKTDFLKKWRGKFFFVEQKKNVLFLESGKFRHPADTESKEDLVLEK